ncbi:hypothetical protein D3C73_776730 [compost metagenome]
MPGRAGTCHSHGADAACIAAEIRIGAEQATARLDEYVAPSALRADAKRVAIAPDGIAARHRDSCGAVIHSSDRAKQVIDLGAIGHRQCTRAGRADEQIARIGPDGIRAIHSDSRGECEWRNIVNGGVTGTQLVQNL